MNRMADGSKTEKATPKKRQDERKKGNIFQSKDLAGALSLLLIIFFLSIIAPLIFDRLKYIISYSLSTAATMDNFNQAASRKLSIDLLFNILIIILPIAAISALAAVITTGAQTRFLFAPDQFKLKFSRLNLLQGLKKMFTFRSLVELLKSSVKIIIIVIVLYNYMQSRFNRAIDMSGYNIGYSFKWICQSVYEMILQVAGLMAGFGILDLLYQWWEYEKQMKMTKNEIKDEYKQIEGDPQIKSKIREKQRHMAQMRMMHQVKTADVVIKNPTHYAVALKYKPELDKAPILVAKGKDLVALRIIAEAEKHGISVTENKPLARGLYEAVELNAKIPEEFYKPVANVLAFIYKLKNSRVVQKSNKSAV
ncbi:MAG: flagellar biosynthesis protein FlhB [Eubacteriales bacterium]